MRKDPFTVGNYIHVYNRGNRKALIVHDENDKWYFLKALRYFNDEYAPQHLWRELALLRRSNLAKHFERSKSWPKHKPLVKILSFCLMPNHFHLLLKEIVEGGVSKFMKKFGDGFTGYSNIKYEQVGRVFQGSYKARTINNDEYLQYIDAYIQFLNPCEVYPGGIKKALKEFDKAFAFAMDDPFCGLGESLGKRKLGIIDRDILREVFPSIRVYKEFAYNALLVKNTKEILGRLSID